MKRILIVDDSAFMRNILKDLLTNKSNGIALKTTVELHEADGKINALKKLDTIKPDLILLDIVMRESETEGLEFIQEIKDTFDINRIVVISSIGQIAMIEKCMKIGIKQYLQKPFDYEQIIEAVNNVLM